jgi:hypothetical protein
MTSTPRIERLTREALGRAKPQGYTDRDDSVLRAVGIVILILTVITFASWPRSDDAAPVPRPIAKAEHASAAITPVAHASADKRAEYTPLY